MAHVSVVKKLERCERIGSARQGEANLLHSDSYQVIKYKIRIKDSSLTATSPPKCKLLHITSKPPSSPSLPSGKLQLLGLRKFIDNELQQNVPCPPLELPHCNTGQENEEESRASWPPWKLQDTAVEQDGKVVCAPWYVQQQTVNNRQEGLRSPSELQKKQQMNGEAERERGVSPWKRQDEGQEKGPGRGFWEAVKKLECECCGMEEECTGGYEERVRARLRGNWLCGLCEEAVGEEKKRVGGSVQAALVAHMQPCRRFARSRVAAPPAEVAVPRAVCRLLCRHLSTPSRHHLISPGAAAALTRSSSCIPSLPKS